jgi:hypothetical protein
VKTKLAVGVHWFSFSCDGSRVRLHDTPGGKLHRPCGINKVNRAGLRGCWRGKRRHRHLRADRQKGVVETKTANIQNIGLG